MQTVDTYPIVVGHDGLTVRDLDAQRLTAGLTVREVARRYRVSPDKVRAWVARGELTAINTATALCGRPRWVILPSALVEFERRRHGGPVPKPQPRRRRHSKDFVDYFP
jgi:excisionase family DNA binding protein